LQTSHQRGIDEDEGDEGEQVKEKQAKKKKKKSGRPDREEWTTLFTLLFTQKISYQVCITLKFQDPDVASETPQSRRRGQG
jgi:fatty acid-binding protein DegV